MNNNKSMKKNKNMKKTKINMNVMKICVKKSKKNVEGEKIRQNTTKGTIIISNNNH